MFKIKILKNLKDKIEYDEAGTCFIDLVSFRQKSFETQNKMILCLDKYDLISTHILLYYENQLVSYVRMTEYSSCLKHETSLPIESSLLGNKRNLYSFKSFCKNQLNIIHMSYLCKDKDYDRQLNNINILDFLTWIAFYSLEIHHSKIAYCSTPNAKYKLLPWLKQLGKHSIGESFKHPSVPEEHELILIHSLSDIYWSNRSKKYAWAIKLIEFIEDEDKDIAA